MGWAESYGSAEGARGAALSECGSRGGSGCTVRVWGCNGHVVSGVTQGSPLWLNACGHNVCTTRRLLCLPRITIFTNNPG